MTWPLVQLRRMARIRNGSDHSQVMEPDGAFPVYGSGGEFARAARPLYEGPAVLLGRKGTIDKPLIVDGKFWTVDTMFCAQPLPGTDPRFLYYVCTTIPFGLLSTSTALPSMTQADLNAVRLPRPSPEDQVAVANFLDQETAKIDALIAKQEQLIATLREDRTATITHAVTKGLDLDTKLHESGVAWLGETPQSWSTARLKHVIHSAAAGTSVNAADWPAGPDEIGVLKTSCVSAGWFNPEANKVVVDDVEKARVTCRIQADSLVVNRANTPLLVGSAGYVPADLDNIFLSDKLWQVRFRGALAKFIYYWTRTEVYRSQIVALCVGASSSMQNLAMVDFKNMVIALPPVDQQEAIVHFLDGRTSQIDSLATQGLAMINTLREYRAALITDAVTGKIDVRGVA